jgi:hypothetical protein
MACWVLPRVLAYPVSQITDDDIMNAKVSGAMLLSVCIRKTYKDDGFDATKALAQSIFDVAHGYSIGIPVLFKPTLAYGENTFRLAEKEVLCYGTARYISLR